MIVPDIPSYDIAQEYRNHPLYLNNKRHINRLAKKMRALFPDVENIVCSIPVDPEDGSQDLIFVELMLLPWFDFNRLRNFMKDLDDEKTPSCIIPSYRIRSGEPGVWIQVED